jgi:hypothetical protein
MRVAREVAGYVANLGQLVCIDPALWSLDIGSSKVRSPRSTCGAFNARTYTHSMYGCAPPAASCLLVP